MVGNNYCDPHSLPHKLILLITISIKLILFMIITIKDIVPIIGTNDTNSISRKLLISICFLFIFKSYNDIPIYNIQYEKHENKYNNNNPITINI